MTDAARRNIFDRLRRCCSSGAVPPRDMAVMRRLWSEEERIARFTMMLSAVHAEVHHTTAQEWTGDLAGMLAERDVRSVLYAPETPLGAALDARRERLPERVRYAASIEDFKPALFNEVDAAVTTARAGIAETGSLVLWPSPDEPRLMSLVPPLHVAVLALDRLYNTFYEAMTREGWTDAMPTNALLISGPSKTADIEQTLAYGVHGPRALIVLLVEGGP